MVDWVVNGWSVNMTKKDYIAIAKVVKETRTSTQIVGRAETISNTCNEIAHGLAVVMQKDNPNFDRNRFLIACGVTIG